MASETYATLLRELARIIEEFGEAEALQMVLEFRSKLIAEKMPTALADEKSRLYRYPTDEEMDALSQELARESNWQRTYKLLFDQHLQRPDLVRLAGKSGVHITKSDDVGTIMKNIAKKGKKRAKAN